MEDELLDLVNEFDQVIGQEYRSNVYKNQLKYTRVVNAFIVNSKGQLWIPRRTAHKELFPSALDVSVGGHVSASENYETAFWREAQEELGLDIRNFILIFLQFSTMFHVSCRRMKFLQMKFHRSIKMILVNTTGFIPKKF